ncbi:MAG: hypothetical protein JNL96_09105 [Planctomycetaceae bacterium]|nr:hypothetical protein [Planctomycetaceae bacterium]
MHRYFILVVAVVCGLTVSVLDAEWEEKHRPNVIAPVPNGPGKAENDRIRWDEPATWHGLLGFYATTYLVGRFLYWLAGAQAEAAEFEFEVGGLLTGLNLICGLIMIVFGWEGIRGAIDARPSFYAGTALHIMALYDSRHRWLRSPGAES